MKSLRWLRLFCIGAVSLILLFSAGCAGKAGPGSSDVFRNPEKIPAQHITERQPASAGGVKTSVEVKREKLLAEQIDEDFAEEDQPREPGQAEGSAQPASETEIREIGIKPFFQEGRKISEKDHFSFQPSHPEKSEDLGDEKITLNFDNADLAEVIRALAGFLEINYIIDSGINGKVTIQTEGTFTKKDLFPVFYQILETNGLTAVPKGNLYRIIPIGDASRMPIASRLGKDSSSAPSGEHFLIQLIDLNFIKASEMAKVLEPFVSSNGTIVTLEDSNIIMVVDHAGNIAKILRMVNTFDIDMFRDVRYRFYFLKYAEADSLAKTLEQMLKSFGVMLETKLTMIPIARLNALLVVSSREKIFEEIDRFVNEFDVASTSTESSIYVYSVENGRAGEISDILGKVFSGKSRSSDQKDRDRVYRNPLVRDAVDRNAQVREGSGEEPPAENGPEAAETTGGSPFVSSAGGVTISSGSLHGDVKITPDEVRNNLIIEATPADYQVVKNLLTQVDILPRQVLIEVTIAEITLDKSSELGVEWTYFKGDENLSTSLLNAALDSSGLRYTIGKADRWTATMKALASKNKVNILSSPSILASNSEPAKIDISTEVPVASSQYEYTSGDNPVISTNIQYRDTGVMLDVTPHINKNGLVTMEISQEVSEQAQSVTVGNLNYPSFFKRSANTILTVQSGQAIVIGGLIRENRTDGSAGAPWSVNIPVLKYLFGRSSKSFEKTELVILISPRVITSLDDVDIVTTEFRNKVADVYQGNNF